MDMLANQRSYLIIVAEALHIMKANPALPTNIVTTKVIGFIATQVFLKINSPEIFSNLRFSSFMDCLWIREFLLSYKIIILNVIF